MARSARASKRHHLHGSRSAKGQLSKKLIRFRLLMLAHQIWRGNGMPDNLDTGQLDQAFGGLVGGTLALSRLSSRRA